MATKVETYKETIQVPQVRTVSELNPNYTKYGLTADKVKTASMKGQDLYLVTNPLTGKTEVMATDLGATKGVWTALGGKRIDDPYITKTYTEMVDQEVERQRVVEVPEPKKKSSGASRTVGGNSSNQTQAATTSTEQTGKQTQGTEQAQHNESDQSLSGQGNVALVVTPNAESNQQLESQAFGSATQTQQVEVASQADAASQMNNEQYATAATYHVAPVINISADDVYNSSSSSEYQRQFTKTTDVDGNTLALCALGAIAGIFWLVSRRKEVKPTPKRRK